VSKLNPNQYGMANGIPVYDPSGFNNAAPKSFCCGGQNCGEEDTTPSTIKPLNLINDIDDQLGKLKDLITVVANQVVVLLKPEDPKTTVVYPAQSPPTTPESPLTESLLATQTKVRELQCLVENLISRFDV